MKLTDFRGQKTANVTTTTLADGGAFQVPGIGDKFYLIESTGTIKIKQAGGSFKEYVAQQGEVADADNLMETLEVSNNSGAPVTFSLWFGFGEFIDKRKEVTVSGIVAISTIPLPTVERTSDSVTEMTKTEGTKNVAAAGTPVRLVAASNKVEYVKIRAKPGNTDIIKVGFSNVTCVWDLTATEVYELRAPAGKRIDLTNIWLDSVVNGEGVIFHAIN